MNKLNNDDIYNKNILEEKIQIIEGMNFEGKSFEEIKGIFLSTLGGLPINVLTFSLDTPIYRARIIDYTEDLSNPSTFSYPPPRYSSRGRANLKGYSVFYGAVGVATILHEIKCTPKDPVYIGKWTVAKGTNVNGVVFLYDTKKGVSKLWNPANEANIAKSKEVIKHLSPEKQEAFMHLSFRLGEWFLNKVHTHSSFLAHLALYDSAKNIPAPHRVDLISYPSIAANMLGVNYAFHPNFVSKMTLQKVIKCNLNTPLEDIVTGDKSFLTNLNRVGDNINGTIKWRDPLPEDIDDFH